MTKQEAAQELALVIREESDGYVDLAEGQALRVVQRLRSMTDGSLQRYLSGSA